MSEHLFFFVFSCLFSFGAQLSVSNDEAPNSQSANAWIHESLDDTISIPVRCICKSSTGAIWIGTKAGLYIYDGGFERVIQPDDSVQLPAEDIHQLHEDAFGRLWIASKGRISMLDLHSGILLTTLLPKPLDGAKVTALGVRSKSQILLGTYDSNIVHITVDDAILRVTEWTKLRDREVQYSLPTSDGSIQKKAVQQKARVAKILVENCGTAWIGTYTGLYKLNLNDVKPLLVWPEIVKHRVNDISLDSNENLWFVGFHNIYKKKKTSDQLSTMKSPHVNMNSSLREDSDGNFWIGNSQQGLILVDPDFNVVERLPHKCKKMLAGTQNEEYLFLNHEFGLELIRRPFCQKFDNPFYSLRETFNSLSISETSSRRLLASKHRVVSLGRNGKYITEIETGRGNSVIAAHIDSDGSLVVLSKDSCIVKKNGVPTKVQLTRVEQSVNAAKFQEFQCATITKCDKGFLLQRGADLHILNVNSMSVDSVANSFNALDSYSNSPALLVNENGILESIRGKSGKVFQFEISENRFVLDYLVEADFILCTTPRGILQLSRRNGSVSNWPPCQDWKRGNDRGVRLDKSTWCVSSRLGRYAIYDETTNQLEDLSTQAHLHYSKYLIRVDDSLIGLGDNGHLQWKINDILANRVASPPRISLLGGMNSLLLKADSNHVYHIVRPFNQRSFSLRFLSEADTGRMAEFKVQLPGKQTWTDFKRADKISFYSLNPGKHYVSIKQRSRSGAFSEPSRVSITISPPWYNSTEFYVLASLVFCMFGIAYVLANRRRVTKLEQEVSARKRVESQLRKSQDTLVKRERLAAFGEMAAGVSHDVNNLLSPILIYGEMLASETIANDQTKNIGRILAEQASDAAKIIRRLSPIYRQVGQEREVVELVEIVNSCVALVQETVGSLSRGKEIDFVTETATVNLTCAPADLREVLTNLLNNAVDAIHMKGEVTVRCGMDMECQNVAWIEVEDDGCGMSPEVSKSCFDAFYTTGKKLGTGIGLAVCQSILRAYSGLISVRSEPGKGTVFRIEIPNTPIDLAISHESNAIVNKKRILLVDDVDVTRASLVALLESLDHEVIPVANVREARSWLVENDCDLVLTDHEMVNETGFEFSRSLRIARPEIFVVLMSGFEETGMRESCHQFLLKPISRRTMQNMLTNVFIQPKKNS